MAREFSHVVVSLDATTEELYHAVRGVAALEMVERGVACLRRMAPSLPVTARATLHRMNFRELPKLIDHAKAMALDGISFQAADMSSPAFGRERVSQAGALALDAGETAELDAIVEETIEAYRDDIERGFVTESADRLRRLGRHYSALADGAAFPPVSCNVPYVSVVVEADGAVRPCSFHEVIGNVRRTPLGSIVARNLQDFRRRLDVGNNPVCARCVCPVRSRWGSAPWH